MRNSLVIALLTILVIGCKPTVPSEYIQPGELEDILYDYHVSQAMAKEKSTGGHEDAEYKQNVYFRAVLKKYDITEAVFDSSLIYYYSHADRLKEIYTRVTERLNDDAKELGASVGDINRYSQYSETGDTANIWKNETDVLLIPKPTANRFDIHVEADTSFYQGDSFMFQFMSDFLYQNGSRDAIMCLTAKYENDSITQSVSRISSSGMTQLRIPHYQEGRLKELNGFIYLNNDLHEEGDIRKLMFISQIQLIRFHHKEEKDEPKNDTENKADSLRRTPDASGNSADTTRRGNIPRKGSPVLSAKEGTSVYRVGNVELKPAKR